MGRKSNIEEVFIKGLWAQEEESCAKNPKHDQSDIKSFNKDAQNTQGN